MRIIGIIGKIILVLTLAIVTLVFVFSKRDTPRRIDYGVSFSRLHSDELELPWRDVYHFLLDDLGVRKFRFIAHWPMVEPSKDIYSFEEMDYQMEKAREAGAEVIMAVGRRVPGWPECHDPAWTDGLSKEAMEKEVLAYIEAVVERYKGYRNIKYWQVENEPFLSGFARHVCGPLNKEFLDKEIELVESLDPKREILITDSGELSLWYQAYKRGDIFGTSVYLYVWTHWGGPLRYPITPAFFRAKRNIISLIYGDKETILIELSTEPWLLQPIVDTDIQTLLNRMGIDKFDQMIQFARESSFDTQYLWGAEWWYWMMQEGHPEYIERARELFRD